MAKQLTFKKRGWICRDDTYDKQFLHLCVNEKPEYLDFGGWGMWRCPNGLHLPENQFRWLTPKEGAIEVEITIKIKE